MWPVTITADSITWWIAGVRLTYSGSTKSRSDWVMGTAPGAFAFMRFAARHWLRVLIAEGRIAQRHEALDRFADIMRWALERSSRQG